MARNVEIKARVADMPALRAKAAALAGSAREVLMQDDTFFRCDGARLKLRVFADSTAELIAYRRADDAGPKPSDYLRCPVEAPDALREVLQDAYGLAGRVRKRRELFIVGRTRIHLDAVEGLGDYVELEVVLADGEPVDDGVREAHALMRALGIGDDTLVDRAYVDLLADAAELHPRPSA